MAFSFMLIWHKKQEFLAESYTDKAFCKRDNQASSVTIHKQNNDDYDADSLRKKKQHQEIK